MQPKSIADGDIDTVDALLENSLLRSEVQPDGEPRFFMLETIRDYATRAARASRASWTSSARGMRAGTQIGSQAGRTSGSPGG